MAKKKSTDELRLCEAALRLAASQGWEQLSLDRIAQAAKIPAAKIKKQYATINALLPALARHITAEMFNAAGKPDVKASPHDRLFEILMARFDVMQKHRKAIQSIANAARRDPRMALILAPAQIAAMKSTLACAGLVSQKPFSDLPPVALWLVYLTACHTWKSDETLDMSRTMAALDRALRIADRGATLLRMNSA